MKTLRIRVRMLLLAMLAGAPVAQATQLATEPLDTHGLAKPNVVFGMDDSGSMDFELMLRTNDGALWWNTSARSAWDAAGQPNFNAGGSTSSPWAKYAYLFPNGCSEARRLLCDSGGHYAVPPTAQFASLRSAAYNPLYYNPAIDYTAWRAAWVNGAAASYAEVPPAAARSHPVFEPSVTDNLTANWALTGSNQTFRVQAGMVLPAGTRYRSGSSWTTASKDVTVGSAANYAFEFYPATYWMPETCTVDNVSCARAPDGATLKRYEIRTGNSFPSGRSYAAELQNFANWFTYYRKRKLMLAAAMGSVLTDLGGVRAGLVQFNDRRTVTMLDLDSSVAAQNGQALAGLFYTNPSSGGTPTRETLAFIGQQYETNRDIVQHSCQRNAAFIVTDGFAYANPVTVPAYDSTRFGAGAPYQKTWSGSLADLALAYYTKPLRAGEFVAGKVPEAPDTGAATDRNTELHVNTHAITLGARGTLWSGTEDAYAAPPAWPQPTDRSPTSVDDLWHATVNGRGLMLSADDPEQTALAMRKVLTEILRQAGSQSAVATSTVNPNDSNHLAYVGLYLPGGWSGDLRAHDVGLADGALASESRWSAAARLDATDWRARHLATRAGAFVPEALDTSSWSGSDFEPAALVAYLRGNRAGEGTQFRARTSRLGAVVNAEAVLGPGRTLYQAANDGMVHAFDADTGAERWAYVPSFVVPALAQYAAPGWRYRPLLDATPSLGRVGTRTVLVGGAGAGARAFYALDVTDPAASTDSEVAAKVLWEFPGAATPMAARANVGFSFGRPVIVKTASAGTVVLLTSGYNSSGDGRGHVFMLDALTGTLVREFVTADGAPGADAGLAQVSAFVPTGSDTAQYAYAGDERGNLWRFDLDSGAVLRLARFVDASGVAQPVTSAPELATYQGRRVVAVGTGRLLSSNDFGTTSTQSFYVLADTDSAFTDVRAQLTRIGLSVQDERRLSTGDPANWGTRRGWYVDLPAGERVNTDATLVYGTFVFVSNQPSVAACESRSFLYVLSLATGLQQPAEQFAEGVTPYAGVQIGATFATRPVVMRLPSSRLIALQRFYNSTSSRIELPVRLRMTPRKAAWREVLR